MLNDTLRELAIRLLDDPHGISDVAWDLLSQMLVDSEDIFLAIRKAEGRVFLPEGHEIDP